MPRSKSRVQIPSPAPDFFISNWLVLQRRTSSVSERCSQEQGRGTQVVRERSAKAPSHAASTGIQQLRPPVSSLLSRHSGTSDTEHNRNTQSKARLPFRSLRLGARNNAVIVRSNSSRTSLPSRYFGFMWLHRSLTFMVSAGTGMP